MDLISESSTALNGVLILGKAPPAHNAEVAIRELKLLELHRLDEGTGTWRVGKRCTVCRVRLALDLELSCGPNDDELAMFINQLFLQ